MYLSHSAATLAAAAFGKYRQKADSGVRLWTTRLSRWGKRPGHSSRQTVRRVCLQPLASYSFRLLDQLMFQGVAGQFGIALEAHFFQDALAVGADGLDAEEIFLGDFTDGFARGNQAHDLELAVGEPFVRGSFEILCQVKGHFFRQ